MRYEPKVGEPFPLEATATEIEVSEVSEVPVKGGPVRFIEGELVRYNAKGGIDYTIRYHYVVKGEDVFAQ
jgi:hypothetical protein